MNNLESEIQRSFDVLTSFGSSEDRKADLIASKNQFFKLTGDVFEDDKQFEHRMLAFLNWYLLDRAYPEKNRTPAQELYCSYVKRGDTQQAQFLRGYTETVHSLFQVSRVNGNSVELIELFSQRPYAVTERRTVRGINKGDILESRLVPVNTEWLFLKAMCFHPQPARESILKEAKRIEKLQSEESKRHFIFECARRSLKVDRYRQVAIEKIYDFSMTNI